MIALSKKVERELAEETAMGQTIQQTYRHLIQQHIVRQVMSSQNAHIRRGQGGYWETGSVFALFSAAAFCGTLAQIHLG